MIWMWDLYDYSRIAQTVIYNICIEVVSLHECIMHYVFSGALMQPFYSGYDPNYRLHEDEKRGMQSLYRKFTNDEVSFIH